MKMKFINNSRSRKEGQNDNDTVILKAVTVGAGANQNEGWVAKASLEREGTAFHGSTVKHE